MKSDRISVVLDRRKRRVVVAISRHGATEREQRGMPKDPGHIQGLFRRLRREGRVEACDEAGVSGYAVYDHITACQARRHRGGMASPLPHASGACCDGAMRAVAPRARTVPTPGNMSAPTRERLACPHRPRDRGSPKKVLDGPSFHISAKAAPASGYGVRSLGVLPTFPSADFCSRPAGSSMRGSSGCAR